MPARVLRTVCGHPRAAGLGPRDHADASILRNRAAPLRAWGRFRTERKRGAITLIEVVASLVLLGSAVTTMLVAQANAVQTVAESKFYLEARAIASNLIAEWRITTVDVTQPGQDGVTDVPDWSWRRSTVPRASDEQPKVVEIVLEILHRDPDSWIERRAEYRWLVAPGKKTNG